MFLHSIKKPLHKRRGFFILKQTVKVVYYNMIEIDSGLH